MQEVIQEGPQTIIVFFDGICHLCNGFVDFLIQQDEKRLRKVNSDPMNNKASTRRFHFAPLQGETARRLLSESDRQSLETVIVRRADGSLLKKSEAVLFCFSCLGGIFKIVSVFRWLPIFVRDGVYLWVAKSRYQIWGKEDVCRIPTAAEKEFLLP